MEEITSFKFGEPLYDKNTSIEDIIESKVREFVDKEWLNRSSETFDSEVVYYIKQGETAQLITESYRFFYAARKFAVCFPKFVGQYPLAIGSHVVPMVGSDKAILFLGKNKLLSIPGGIVDLADISSGKLDPRIAAAREMKEETGLSIEIQNIFDQKCWFDVSRPHIFFTHKTKVSEEEIYRMLEIDTVDKNEFYTAGIFLARHVRDHHDILAKATRGALS